jgi:modulator of FtsH protease
VGRPARPAGGAVAIDLAGWHDFFLATAGASAALLGLLFVGVSINLGAIAATERGDLRARAAQAFTNLLSVLGISLFLLVPDFDPASVGLWLGVIAAFGLLRAARNVRMVVAGPRAIRSGPIGPRLPTIRRIAWTIVADLLLGLTAWRLAVTAGAANVVPNLVAVVFVLMLGAADIAWEILTDVGA